MLLMDYHMLTKIYKIGSLPLVHQMLYNFRLKQFNKSNELERKLKQM